MTSHTQVATLRPAGVPEPYAPAPRETPRGSAPGERASRQRAAGAAGGGRGHVTVAPAARGLV